MLTSWIIEQQHGFLPVDALWYKALSLHILEEKTVASATLFQTLEVFPFSFEDFRNIPTTPFIPCYLLPIVERDNKNYRDLEDSDSYAQIFLGHLHERFHCEKRTANWREMQTWASQNDKQILSKKKTTHGLRPQATILLHSEPEFTMKYLTQLRITAAFPQVVVKISPFQVVCH